MKLLSFFFYFILSATSVINSHCSEYIPKEISYKYRFYDNLDLPKEFSWDNVNGTNYLTKNLNQHLPNYCGSCFIHGALSALADRIKIARKAREPDINLAIQFILNCGNAGTCQGGDHLQVYKFIHDYGSVPYDTCLAYEACSSDSPEKACQNRDYSCKPINICRTCYSFTSEGGGCASISPYPNATISKYGSIMGANNIKNEIYRNGPVACGINADAILDYQGGVLDLPDASREINHIVSITGWGFDEDLGKEYFIIRNSWGEYYAELGFLKVVSGENQLGLENSCVWAEPGSWTEMNKPCDLNGSNCQDHNKNQVWVSETPVTIHTKGLPLDTDYINDPSHHELLNSDEDTWVAGHNEYFTNKTYEEVSHLMGTIPRNLDIGNTCPTEEDSDDDGSDIPTEFSALLEWPGLISPIRDQGRCGSCYAVSAAEVLTDRFAISTNSSKSPILSPEDIVSCDNAEHACGGGELPSTWKYMVQKGLVTENCLPYSAGNGTAPSCPIKKKCADGSRWKKYKALNSYPIKGVKNIQRELMTNGPIQVAFSVYKSFMSYKYGVYKKKWYEVIPEGGHAVRLLGFGTENGQDYWLVANSWGEHWGIGGYFKIARGTDECAIETSGPPYSGIASI